MDGLRNSLVVQMVKNLTAMQENGVWSIPGSETCPGGGNGYPLQYSCLDDSMDEPGGLQSAGLQRVEYD